MHFKMSKDILGGIAIGIGIVSLGEKHWVVGGAIVALGLYLVAL